MITVRLRRWLPVSVMFLAGLAIAGAAEQVAYRGWPGALRLRNEQVEAVIVPAVGRVMSFRFLDGENVFWEDDALAGKEGDGRGREWVNFGGDKAWPSPEAEWGKFTRQTDWMPPVGFDGLPVVAKIEGDTVVLRSPTDRSYGIRMTRRITLKPERPVMSIETTFERESGEPAKIGIWVIAQFKEPVAVYVPVAATTRFPHGYFIFRNRPWSQLEPARDWVKLTRDPSANHKLGSDAERLVWVGEKAMCVLSAPRIAGAEYPDQGASAEVFTSENPKRYVELEILGPLALLKPGETIRYTTTYTLFRRRAASADDDARRVLGP